MPGPSILAVIPARLQSTRLPNKPLLKIGSQTMLERVWKRANLARHVSRTIIATCDAAIRDTAEGFGATVVMTSPDLPSGTDRVSQAMEQLQEQFTTSLVVNVQGDEPFLDPEAIDLAVEALFNAPDAAMSTLKVRFPSAVEAAEPSAVKVVTDAAGNALYFSRLPIPCWRDPESEGRPVWYKHIGLYVYRTEFLLAFPKLPRGPLEIAEKLEQLRALENGYKIQVAETVHDSIGVDTAADLARARQLVPPETIQNQIEEKLHV